MAQRLKRWESPRQQGRNEKGRGGSARQRQLKKKHKQFLKQLKAQAKANAAARPDKPAQGIVHHSQPRLGSSETLVPLKKGKRFESLTLSFMAIAV